tara:strand:- start:801 stop:1217 length:417 start_codon:yes stop_codon:yes gene_type:complete
MNNIGISVNELKIIDNFNGSIMHALKKSDIDFRGFGEVYFSQVKYKRIKAWKRHKKMTMNLFVPVGNVKFVFFNANKKEFQEYNIGTENYCRITVDPMIWFGFQGLNKGNNLVMNFANIEHDPDEVERINLLDLKYNW